MYNLGLLGNPNYKIKLFLKDENVLSIINNNTIYFYSVNSKIKTLLSYYLPHSKAVDDFKLITKYKYVITSKIDYLEKLDFQQSFIAVNKFDNHLLLMKIDE